MGSRASNVYMEDLVTENRPDKGEEIKKNAIIPYMTTVFTY